MTTPGYRRLTCSLCATFALLILSLRVVGAATPPPESLAHLHLSDCALPCWLGIIPGETRFTDAVEQVTARNPGGAFTSGYGTAVISAYQVGSPLGQVGLYAASDGTVKQITLLTSRIEGITFGDVVSFLGIPTCETRYPASAVYVSASAFAVLIGSRTDRGWRTPLNNIEIRGIDGETQPCARLIN